MSQDNLENKKLEGFQVLFLCSSPLYSKNNKMLELKIN